MLFDFCFVKGNIFGYEFEKKITQQQQQQNPGYELAKNNNIRTQLDTKLGIS